jgi:5-methylthioadenosine/S-adenosylhomocysteine deaminase
MPAFSASLIYNPPAVITDGAFVVENGLITWVGPQAHCPVPITTRFENALLVPGLINTHTHAFQSLLKGVADDEDFFTWRDKALYGIGARLTPEDLYTGALFAFAEMALTGVTTVCDFFYINDQANENAQAVIQAAQDLGLRCVLARCLYDWDGAPARFRETVDQAIDNTGRLMTAYAQHPTVSVLPAPHSLHAASPEMIQAGAALAKDHHTRFHLHLAEGQYEREQVLAKTGQTPVGYLHQLGVLTSDLVAIHAVWIDPNDITLMANARCGVAYNPSSNMFLGDGITPITALRDHGVSISLGTDGGCSNNRASIIEEMRMTSLLQKVQHLNGTVIKAEDCLKMATVNGGINLNLPIGRLEPGYAGDFTVIDLSDLSMQPLVQPLKNLVYSAQPSAVQAAYVAGKPVMQHGQLVNVPVEQVVESIQRTWARLR